MNLTQPASQILPASEADFPGIAALAGVIWRAHYPGIISTEQIDYMLSKMALKPIHCLRSVALRRASVLAELKAQEQPSLNRLVHAIRC
jgi:hypothetical protein